MLIVVNDTTMYGWYYIYRVSLGLGIPAVCCVGFWVIVLTCRRYRKIKIARTSDMSIATTVYCSNIITSYVLCLHVYIAAIGTCTTESQSGNLTGPGNDCQFDTSTDVSSLTDNGTSSELYPISSTFNPYSVPKTEKQGDDKSTVNGPPPYSSLYTQTLLQ